MKDFALFRFNIVSQCIAAEAPELTEICGLPAPRF